MLLRGFPGMPWGRSQGCGSSGPPHSWGWLPSSIASDTTLPLRDEGLCGEEVTPQSQPSVAAGRESGASLYLAPVLVPYLPRFHPSRPWYDLPPLGSAPPGSPCHADTASSFQSLCQSPILTKELGSGRTMVPIQRCLELDPCRDGPILCPRRWLPLSLPAPSTDWG